MSDPVPMVKHPCEWPEGCEHTPKHCARVEYESQRRIYAAKGQPTDAPDLLARRLANGVSRIVEETGCWEWGKWRNNAGYGLLHAKGRHTYAHRLAVELTGRTIGPGMDVMHACDNPPCINPAHLSVGSRRDNVLDACAKGRMRRPVPRRVYGDANPFSKLRDADVALIRELLWEGMTQRRVAEMFGVYVGHIGRIWRGETRTGGGSR